MSGNASGRAERTGTVTGRGAAGSSNIEKALTLLPDVPAIYSAWKQIVAAHKVQGVKVYDARLAAIMSVYSVESVLTINSVDFERFTNVHAIHPASLVP